MKNISRNEYLHLKKYGIGFSGSSFNGGNLTAFFLLLLSVFLLCSCGGQTDSSSDSQEKPSLTEYSSYGECRGGEEDQYILASLVFDRPVTTEEGLAGDLRITIGGNRIKEEEISFEQTDEQTVTLQMHVRQVDSGELLITNAPGQSTVPSIQSRDTGTAVGTIDVNMIIPSGVSISAIRNEAGNSIYSVDSLPTHRCIIWLQLGSEEDTALSPEGSSSVDILDQAAAVHEHEFLWATKTSVAEDMAETINRYWPSSYSARAEGEQLIITANDGTSIPELRIYEGLQDDKE